MNIDERFIPLVPKLRQLALRYRSRYAVLDEDDLFSEMVVFLFGEWDRGALEEKTESYIVQACYFHLRNYLRTAGDHCQMVPLEGASTRKDTDGERSLGLEETVADRDLSMAEYSEGKALYETIMNNGFKKIEKEIVQFLVEGYTVREIGKKLDISHAMVVKYKKAVSYKVSKKYAGLLV